MPRAAISTPITDAKIRGAVTAETVGRKLHALTAQETAAGIVDGGIADWTAAPGSVLRYGNNTTPGTTDLSTALQAAIDQNLQGGAAVELPDEEIAFGTTLEIGSRLMIRGAGRVRSRLSYTGAAHAFSNVTGTRIFDVVMRDFELRDTGTGTVGLHLEDVATSQFSNLNIDAFGAAVELDSTVSGRSIYNRFYNVTASNATIGFDLQDQSTNSNTFLACRCNVCTTGFQITDCNGVHIEGCQIESGGTGVSLVANGPGENIRTMIAFNRFEANTTNVSIGSDVSQTLLFGNYHVDGVTLSDSGDATQNMDAYSDEAGLSLVSAMAAATGSPFGFERTANGGSNVPMAVFKDSNSGSGTPTTVQIETERALGLFLRGMRGGAEYFSVNAQGNLKFAGELDHEGTTAGFYGSAPVTKRTITGSRAGNAALASLLTQLATLGLITDSTSA